MSDEDSGTKQVNIRLHPDQFAALERLAIRADLKLATYAKSVIAEHLNSDLSGEVGRSLLLEQLDQLRELQRLVTAVLCAALMPSVTGSGRDERLSSLLSLVDRSMRSAFLIKDTVDGWQPESGAEKGGD